MAGATLRSPCAWWARDLTGNNILWQWGGIARDGALVLFLAASAGLRDSPSARTRRPRAARVRPRSPA